LPHHNAGVRKYRVWQTAGRHFSQTAKEQAQREGDRQGLKNGPKNPQQGLLVADFDIPPSQKIEQLAISPEFTEA
jgi:hypothetical protein